MANPLRPLQEAVYQASAGSVPIKTMASGGLEDSGEPYPVHDYLPPSVGEEYIAMESEEVVEVRVSKRAKQYECTFTLILNNLGRGGAACRAAANDLIDALDGLTVTGYDTVRQSETVRRYMAQDEAGRQAFQAEVTGSIVLQE